MTGLEVTALDVNVNDRVRDDRLDVTANDRINDRIRDDHTRRNRKSPNPA